jgi:hypothetical protein
LKNKCHHEYEYQPLSDNGTIDSLLELKFFKWEVKKIKEATYWKCKKCGKLLTLYGPNVLEKEGMLSECI